MIHAAGAIDDAPLHTKTRDDLDAILGGKARGAHTLAEWARGQRLDSLVFFSSVSAVLGPPGQTDYVAANSYLDALAERLAAEGVPARAIGWAAWSEIGMAVQAIAPPRARGGEAVAHPLLQRRLASDNGTKRYAANFDATRLWVLDEHRVRGGGPVLPGTAFLEIARAAAQDASGDDGPVEIADLMFTAPLLVPESQPVPVETSLRMEDDGWHSLSVGSVGGGHAVTENATARVRVIEGWDPDPVDLDVLEGRCGERRLDFEAGEQELPQDEHLAFGARWKVLRSLRFGETEAVARLELAEDFARDLDSHALHPGLLDMATGFAFSLLGDRSGTGRVLVPLSYRRFRARGPLPRRLVSHVRIRPESRDDLGVIDATLADEEGRVVVEIEGYVVRSVEPRALAPTPTPDSVRPSSPLETWVEHGIAPDEGFDMLCRVLAPGAPPRVLVSPRDLLTAVAELREPPAPADEDSAEPSTPPSGDDVPRDDIERRLATMWGTLLGAASVGRRDDFFELGGHSLVAVRLFARVKKAFEVDLPLATLFEAPTVEALAQVLRSRLGLPSPDEVAGTPSPSSSSASEEWSPLVTIRKGGARAPFFCVHGAGGNLLNFWDVAQLLDPELPVFGLQARGVDGRLPPAESVEEMASLYLPALRQQRPDGPHLLGGYSGGGVVALEMAQRLTAAGEPPAHVVLFDTFHPSTQARSPSAADHLRELAAQGPAYLHRRLRARLTRQFTEMSRELLLRYHLSLGRGLPHDLRDVQVTRQFLEVASRYSPRPYEGPITLFRAHDVALVYQHMGPRLGWDEVLPQLNVVEVPGTHDNMVRGPNAHVLASLLEDVLRRASEPTRR